MSYSRFVEQERMERNAVNAKRPKPGTPPRDPETWLRFRNCAGCGVEWTVHVSSFAEVGWVGPCCLRDAA
jgi:hypothetical protein